MMYLYILPNIIVFSTSYYKINSFTSKVLNYILPEADILFASKSINAQIYTGCPDQMLTPFGSKFL